MAFEGQFGIDAANSLKIRMFALFASVSADHSKRIVNNKKISTCDFNL